MKLYQTIDGTLIGFYKERGGAVQALLYRDIYEKQLVTKTREERVYVQGHYERQMIWHPEHSVTRYREVPGHYEIKREYVQGHYERQMVWHPEYYVTRYYWREAHPARGLEAAWIPYQHLMPAGERETRVWVEGKYKDVEFWVATYTEQYQEVMPAGERETRVWVEGKYVIEKKEYQVLEDVWVGQEPVYGYVDPMQVQMFEVGELIPAPADRPDLEDIIEIINTETGEVFRTTATYIGLAEQIDDNEYVVP